MINMEISEVVNPHFALPVMGVVFCALLVFAFGFKSPAPPPSFDFEYEERRNRRNKKGKKVTSNGHAVAIEPVVSKPVSSANKQSPSAKTEPPTKTVEKEPNKTKAKKAAKSPKVDVKLVASPAKVAHAKEKEEDLALSGEWTTAISRKDKRNNKGRVVMEPVIPEPEPEPEPVPEVAEVTPKVEKSAKKDKKKAKEVAPAVDSSDKENTIPEVEIIKPEPLKTPKKKKGKKAASPEPEARPEAKPEPKPEPKPEVKPEPEVESVPKIAEVVVEAAPVSVEASAPEVDPKAAEAVTAQLLEAAIDIDDKPAKSPKKKNKKKPAQEKAEAAPTTVIEKPAPSKPVEAAPAPVEPTPAPVAPVKEVAPVPSPAGDAPAPPTPENKPAFDELGAAEWEDAKPVKRKKKARRD